MQILQRLFKYQLIISLCSPSVLTHLSHTKVYKNLVLKPEVFAPPIQRLIDDRCEANQFFLYIPFEEGEFLVQIQKKISKQKQKAPTSGHCAKVGRKTPFHHRGSYFIHHLATGQL